MGRRKYSAEDYEVEEEIRSMDTWRNEQGYKDQKKELENLSVTVKCKTPGQKELIKAIRSKEVTFCAGMAGTGKTYLACAQAAKMLKSFAKYEKIIIAKSVTAIPGEEIGFLKGSWQEKMEPFMWSYWTNFEKIIGKAELARLRNMGLIEVWPLAFIRGSNIDNTITIVDEAQNITKGTMKTILTRLGKDSKMIFLGDTDQVDLKKSQDSCLDFYINKFKDFDPFGIVELTADDEVRNPLIKHYLAKLNKIEEDEKD
jgi:phosphate starvation-inducible protein PhoH and related proteins